MLLEAFTARIRCTVRGNSRRERHPDNSYAINFFHFNFHGANSLVLSLSPSAPWPPRFLCRFSSSRICQSPRVTRSLRRSSSPYSVFFVSRHPSRRGVERRNSHGKKWVAPAKSRAEKRERKKEKGRTYRTFWERMGTSVFGSTLPFLCDF